MNKHTPMTLDDYRRKLMSKIIVAGSEEESLRFVDAALKSLVKNKVNGYIIERFIDKAIVDSDRVLMQDIDENRSGNIKTVRARLFVAKQGLSAKPV